MELVLKAPVEVKAWVANVAYRFMANPCKVNGDFHRGKMPFLKWLSPDRTPRFLYLKRGSIWVVYHLGKSGLVRFLYNAEITSNEVAFVSDNLLETSVTDSWTGSTLLVQN